MRNISGLSVFKLFAISLLLSLYSGCSDQKKEDDAAFKEGVAAYTKGDYGIALDKFRQLADKDNAEAQYNLGVMYQEGRGVSQDNQKAVELWTHAADQGITRAMFRLGVMYMKGAGVPADAKKAFENWEQAAEQGHNLSQMYLGILYAQGSGIQQDPVQAYKWFSIAAAGNNKAAAQNLGTVSKTMNEQQIEQGKQLADEWLKSHETKK